jgi:GTP1/Obg family GTP-binding protein
MVEAGKMEVDLEESTHESAEAQPKIKPDAPTVLIAMGMAGSGKTTFVHVSIQQYNQVSKAADKLS